MDVARYARQIALPEVGPEGQARICAARVAVIGVDLTAETAALYLRAAGAQVVEDEHEGAKARGSSSGGEGSAAERWRMFLSDVDLVVRSGFEDDAMAGAAARLGVPVIVVRAQRDVVDMIICAPQAAAPDATIAAPVAASTPPADGPAAVLAGTLAAAEALHLLARGNEPALPAAPIRHVRLPLDGREPLVQAIGRST